MRLLLPNEPRAPRWRRALGVVLVIAAALLLAEIAGGGRWPATRSLVDF